MEKLQFGDFRCFDDIAGQVPIMIDAVYAQAQHPENIFKTAIYKKNARIWGHYALVEVTLKAAELGYARHGWALVIKDCLRPIDAQQKMIGTEIVQSNPHWIGHLLARPGEGGHPRGMAIDLEPVRAADGQKIDMGTTFDYFSPDPAVNPAARDYHNLPAGVLKDRTRFEQVMLDAAKLCGLRLWPYPAEWWDYRFYPDDYNQFAPLSDHDLPASARLVSG